MIVAAFVATPLCALAPLESTAFAQQDPSPSALKLSGDWTEQGIELGRKGQWAEALEKFKAAGNIKATPQLEFYTGIAESRLGKLVEASIDLRRAVEHARAAGNEKVADAANAELTDVNGRIPSVTLTVNGGATPTGITVDGGSIAVAAAIGNAMPLDPGTHSIVVTFSGGSTTKSVSLHEKDNQQVAIDAPVGSSTGPAVPDTSTPNNPPPGNGNPPPPTPPASSGSNTGKIVGWTMIGVGAASALTSLIFWGNAVSKISDDSQFCSNGECNGSPAARAAITSDDNSARSSEVVAGVFDGIGAVLIGVGIYFVATSGSHGSSTSSASTLVTPWMGPNGGGASLTGHF